jgi:hypothetical protein
MAAPSTNFFQNVIKIHKMWLKLAIIGNNWPFDLFRLFSRFSGRGTHFLHSFRTITLKNENFQKKSENSIFGQFWPILATFYEVKITF